MEGRALVLALVLLAKYIHVGSGQCQSGQELSFARWSGANPEPATPVFVYAASGEEESLAGACLARCRELPVCAGVVVAYSRGHCHGVAVQTEELLRPDNDVAYFKKICAILPEGCAERWWALEATPGYHLHSESNIKAVLNTTAEECYALVLGAPKDQPYRSAQWVRPEGALDADAVKVSDTALGNCVLNAEDKFTEPESYRVANYYTFYVENQCRHDYPKKIDRCSYEEYYNQTLKHVEFTYKNFTKDECKSACESESRFVCRGFTWLQRGEASPRSGARGLCDLHSEDLVSTGSWLLRRATHAVYYRRVICLNISVDCSEDSLIVTYRPRGQFRGRIYVPGREEGCGARGVGGAVTLKLPLRGDCDVNFAHAISQTPGGVVNRTMAYVMVMIQNNPIIQTAGDRWVRVGCSPGDRAAAVPKQVNAAVAVKDTGRPSEPSSGASSPAPASTVYSGGGAPISMYVVRVAQDAPPAATVSLGEPLELRIESAEENEFEVYHLVASSRLGDSSVLLLDSRGCPTGQVDFPAFSRSVSSGTQRLSARFKAFRFPTSHVVRFALMVRFCDKTCDPVNCVTPSARQARMTNDSFSWADGISGGGGGGGGGGDGMPAEVAPAPGADPGWGVVALGAAAPCSPAGRLPLELEMVVGAGDVVSADTVIRADHRSNIPEEQSVVDNGIVCVHELLLVALALTWLAVQVLLLIGCCVLVKRYRKLAELNMQKEYQAFDNMGFDTTSTHRRVHWPDQNIDVLQ